MGKDWLFKAGAGDLPGGPHGGRKPTSTTKPKKPKTHQISSSSSSGCMSAIFHLFDIQNHHFPLNIPQESNFVLKGAEAPRNSLELQEEVTSSLKFKEDTNLKLPISGIQKIKTKGPRLMEDLSSECSSSPGSKTPNLVARLMGLDLLPENSSPRPSSSSTPLNHQSRSSPATPRISTAGRRSTEVDHHHRLSLQINKENRSEYAKQIAKQVRESISRRVAGADITNTINVKNKEEIRRDKNLVLLKSKTTQDESTPSMEVIKKVPHQVPLGKQEVQLAQQEKQGVKVKKCKKIASERYEMRVVKKMEQQPFVKEVMMTCERKWKKKSTEMSNHRLLNVNTTTKFHSFKKDIASPASSTPPKLPQKQVSLTLLPSCQKLSVPDYVTTAHNSPSVSGSGAGSSVSDHHAYVSRILGLSGIDKNTPISITHWYSPSHPLHPSIFLQLEKLLHPTGAGAGAGSRKLIFELVDEILVGILKPYISFKPWVAAKGGLTRRDSCGMCGSELVGKLCERISGFPAADCRVLEDIDKLIDGDIRRSTRRIGAIAYEEEAEEVAAEIERDVLDTLVIEMTWHIRTG